MPLNKKILLKLGIDTPDKLQRLRNKYRGLDDDAINRELRELVALRILTARREIQIQSNFGIPFESDSDNPKFTNYTNELRASRCLASCQNSAGYSYNNRKIETHLQASISNNDFNADDLRKMFEAVFAAAQAVDTSGHAAKQLEFVKREFSNSAMLSKRKKQKNRYGSVPPEMELSLEHDTLHTLLEVMQKGPLEKDELKELLDRITTFHRLFIGRLAIVIWQARHNSEEMPSYEQYKDIVAEIQEKDVNNNSQRKRPIMMHAYRQKLPSNDPNKSYYIITTNTPNSDVSSADRSMANQSMFSNDWTTKVEVIELTHLPNGKIKCKRIKKQEYKRSSSIDRISYGEEAITTGDSDARTLEKREKVYQSFKKLIQQYAKEEIIRRLNNGEKLEDIVPNNTLAVKEAYITLLSPVIPKEKGTGGPSSPIGIKTIYENEEEQMRNTQYCLNRIRTEELSFTDDDIKDIKARTSKAKFAPTKNRLKSIRIKHMSYAANYAVNKIGPVRLERLDIYGANRKYYQAGDKHRREFIVEYIQNKAKSLHLTSEQQLAINQLVGILNKPSEKRISRELSDFLHNNPELMQEMPKIARMLQLYIDIEKYHYFDAYRFYNIIKKDRITASYIAALKDKELAQLLGFTPHITCKSGVDRTGLFAAFVEATTNLDLCNLDRKEVERNVIAALQHGPNRTIKSLNLSGIAGLQLNKNVIKGKANLATFLKHKLFDRIGKMGKAIYHAKEKHYQHALDHHSKSKRNQEFFKKNASLFGYQTVHPSTEIPTSGKPKPTEH